jgi:hypothetical protein
MQNEIDVLSTSRNQDTTIIEQFIVKKTELSDILYFMNEIASGNQCMSSFHSFFFEPDLEMIYETSYFSVTVIDHSSDDQLVGIFIFNDAPFGTTRKDYFPVLKSQGVWEEWFTQHYDEN